MSNNLRSEAARLMGQVSTPKKREAAIATLRKYQASRIPQGCNCDREGEPNPMKHRSRCRLYRRQYKREHKK